MPNTTPLNGWRYPAATDAPDVPGSIYSLATDIEADTGLFTGWTGFTAVPSGITNYATNYCDWRYIAGTVLYRGSIYITSGGVSGNVIIPTPTTMFSRGVAIIGRVYGIDLSDSNRIYTFTANRYSSSQFVIAYQTGSPAADASITATTPVTWAAGDTFNWEIQYDTN